MKGGAARVQDTRKGLDGQMLDERASGYSNLRTIRLCSLLALQFPHVGITALAGFPPAVGCSDQRADINH